MRRRPADPIRDINPLPASRHVMALASPQQLEQQLARADVRLAFPAQTQLVRVASAPAAPMAMAPGAWFALTAEAEASVDPADLQD